MKADEIEDKEIEDFLEFFEIANDTVKERGKEYKFECPVCKGVAEGFKSTYNGHLWAKCEKCNMNVIE